MHYLIQNIQFFKQLRKLDTNTISKTVGKLFPQIETGDTPPRPEELLALSNLFGVTTDNLLRKDFQTTSNILGAKQIKMLILDVDGVMTDGGMYYNGNGDEFKRFNTKDGLAIRRLARKGFPIGIISSGLNKSLIQHRADLLEIKRIHAGKGKKWAILQQWLPELGFGAEHVAFIGDDLNDLEIMENVGLAACPADAVQAIQTIAHVCLSKKGGEACVREFIDDYLIRLSLITY